MTKVERRRMGDGGVGDTHSPVVTAESGQAAPPERPDCCRSRLPSVKAGTDSSLPLIRGHLGRQGGKRDFPVCCLLCPACQIVYIEEEFLPQP